ncbi:unnamed protein product [Anisakis simplex]|uniref:MAM domain-containing protein n=1 Tax=Anisakis simplex TaxID=6269 RepID=A0A0M3K6K5_ANISI|nr:unnamed protein product [Anisakis simplex]
MANDRRAMFAAPHVVTQMAAHQPHFVNEPANAYFHAIASNQLSSPFAVASKNILEKTRFRSFKISKQSTCRMQLLTVSDFYACTTVTPYNDNAHLASDGAMQCDFQSTSNYQSIEWKRGRFEASNVHLLETFAALTGRAIGSTPDREFIFIGETLPHTGYDEAILRADIPCQIGDGRLLFDFWKTDPNVQIKVCTRTDEFRSCTEMIRYNDSSTVDVDVINPKNSSFAIEIIVSSITEPSVLIIDNLRYEATYCTKQPDWRSQSEHHSEAAPDCPVKETAENGTSLPIKRLSACHILNCDFESTLCNWYNAVKADETGR